MTTKDIRLAVSVYAELKRTNIFKRGLDAFLAYGLPVKFEVAQPFKYFKTKDDRGQIRKYKVKITNTETGAWRMLLRFKLEERKFTSGLGYCWTVGNRIYSGGADSKEHFAKDHPEDFSHPQLKEVVTGDYWEETKQSNIGWGDIALAFSKLFKGCIAYTEPCSKCGGSGILPHYMHISEGLCFQCLGQGIFLRADQSGINELKKTVKI